ncbi:MAG: hypothetical protein AAF593_13800 [Planctomycetota bacterium]
MRKSFTFMWFLGLLAAVSCDRPSEARTEATASVVEPTVQVSEPAVERAGDPVRGIVVSCYRWGPGEWDGPGMEPLLDELKTLGVTGMQIHPYARISNDGRVGYRPGPVTPATLKPIRWANERGMTTFLKPHLAYWGSVFSWRGTITFDDEAEWQTFFREYESFIVHQAELAEQADADVFAVGTELHKTLHREADWRRVIAAVRAVYSGKLTYAANWDEKGDVPFWDALDLVGVQFYYPLSEAMPPSDNDLRAGWQKRLGELQAFSAEHDKPILLAELGYAESEEAALHPWSDRMVGDRDAAAALKLRCMRIALEQIEADPVIAGVFLWKWFPGDRDHRDEFVLQYDAMRDVIRGAWGGEMADEVAARETASANSGTAQP